MIHYFAYGSNMDKEDLDNWCRKWDYQIIEFIDVKLAKLSGYKLCFNYYSSGRKGGAVNIMKDQNSCLYGLLIDINNNAKELISKKEGHPNYYRETKVDIETLDNRIVRDVLTYKVVESKEEKQHIKPTKEYLNLIIDNARKYEFPSDYIKFLESISYK